ncbi:unnamed protein product, partial [Adineta steineri]
MAYKEFTASECRAFELVRDEGFFKTAQFIFDPGLSYYGLALRHVTEGFKTLNFIRERFLYDMESQSV